MATNEKICNIYSLLVTIIYLWTATAISIDCSGKPFHCVNSTHFMICVDVGSGVSKTVDDFLIQCPPTTVCRESNHFECEYQVTTTTESIIRQGDETKKFEINSEITTDFPLTKTSPTELLIENFNTVSVKTQIGSLDDVSLQKPNGIVAIAEVSTQETSKANNNLNVLTTTDTYETENLSTDSPTFSNRSDSIGLLKLLEDTQLFENLNTSQFSTQQALLNDQQNKILNKTETFHNTAAYSETINTNMSFNAEPINITLYKTTTEPIVKTPLSIRFSEGNSVPIISTISDFLTAAPSIKYENKNKITVNDDVAENIGALSTDFSTIKTTFSDSYLNGIEKYSVASTSYYNVKDIKLADKEKNAEFDNATQINTTESQDQTINSVTVVSKDSISLDSTMPLTEHTSVPLNVYPGDRNVATTEKLNPTIILSTNKPKEENLILKSTQNVKDMIENQTVIETTENISVKEVTFPEDDSKHVSSIPRITTISYILTTATTVESTTETKTTLSNVTTYRDVNGSSLDIHAVETTLFDRNANSTENYNDLGIFAENKNEISTSDYNLMDIKIIKQEKERTMNFHDETQINTTLQALNATVAIISHKDFTTNPGIFINTTFGITEESPVITMESITQLNENHTNLNEKNIDEPSVRILESTIKFQENNYTIFNEKIKSISNSIAASTTMSVDNGVTTIESNLQSPMQLSTTTATIEYQLSNSTEKLDDLIVDQMSMTNKPTVNTSNQPPTVSNSSVIEVAPSQVYSQHFENSDVNSIPTSTMANFLTAATTMELTTEIRTTISDSSININNDKTSLPDSNMNSTENYNNLSEPAGNKNGTPISNDNLMDIKLTTKEKAIKFGNVTEINTVQSQDKNTTIVSHKDSITHPNILMNTTLPTPVGPVDIALEYTMKLKENTSNSNIISLKTSKGFTTNNTNLMTIQPSTDIPKMAASMSYSTQKIDNLIDILQTPIVYYPTPTSTIADFFTATLNKESTTGSQITESNNFNTNTEVLAMNVHTDKISLYQDNLKGTENYHELGISVGIDSQTSTYEYNLMDIKLSEKEAKKTTTFDNVTQKNKEVSEDPNKTAAEDLHKKSTFNTNLLLNIRHTRTEEPIFTTLETTTKSNEHYITLKGEIESISNSKDLSANDGATLKVSEPTEYKISDSISIRKLNTSSSSIYPHIGNETKNIINVLSQRDSFKEISIQQDRLSVDDSVYIAVPPAVLDDQPDTIENTSNVSLNNLQTSKISENARDTLENQNSNNIVSYQNTSKPETEKITRKIVKVNTLNSTNNVDNTSTHLGVIIGDINNIKQFINKDAVASKLSKEHNVIKTKAIDVPKPTNSKNVKVTTNNTLNDWSNNETSKAKSVYKDLEATKSIINSSLASRGDFKHFDSFPLKVHQTGQMNLSDIKSFPYNFRTKLEGNPSYKKYNTVATTIRSTLLNATERNESLLKPIIPIAINNEPSQYVNKLRISKSVNTKVGYGNSVPFNCINRLRGRHADKNDCRKFYICIGRVYPILGECPLNTVFSEIKKQCTKNLSHCMINNEFHCIREGRFSDLLKNNLYYICVKNKSSYVRFHFQCQSGFHLNKTSVKCIRDTQSQSQTSSTSTDSDSSKTSGQSSTLDTTKEKKNKTEKAKHECRQEGKFPNSDDCRKYYVCSKNSKSVYRRRTKKCDSDEVFHREKKRCVSDDSYECK